MAVFYPADNPRPKRTKSGRDPESMFSGLLMGLAVIGFGACLLLVINGKAEEWLKLLRDSVQERSEVPAK